MWPGWSPGVQPTTLIRTGSWAAVGCDGRRGVTKASQVTEPCTEHGEGPLWDAVGERLLLVDMLLGAVVAVGADASTQRYELGGVAAALRARRDGGHRAHRRDQRMALTRLLKHGLVVLRHDC